MGKALLLDTHTLIWALYSPERLSRTVTDMLSSVEEQVLVSAVSAYEISYKYQLGKLAFAASLARDFGGETAKDGYVALPLAAEHAQRAGLLASEHRDPFDRMLIAQALIEDLILVSNETLFDSSGVERMW